AVDLIGARESTLDEQVAERRGLLLRGALDEVAHARVERRLVDDASLDEELSEGGVETRSRA
ncbi:MAG: hypothetical protein RLZZ238_1642, partial [Planctomycetota bacterium]